MLITILVIPTRESFGSDIFFFYFRHSSSGSTFFAERATNVNTEKYYYYYYFIINKDRLYDVDYFINRLTIVPYDRVSLHLTRC